MTVEAMIKVWAAKKLRLRPETIERVDFQEYPGGWLSEYTYDPAYTQAKVRVKNGELQYIPLYDSHIPDLLKEILEANE